MGRLNVIYMLGRVRKAPQVNIVAETGEYNYAMSYIDVVRSIRNIDDKLKYVRHDYPLIISRDHEVIEKMLTWKENTVVYIKGTLNTRKITKSSYCDFCTDEEGNATKNVYEGNLVYITPIYVSTRKDCETKQEAVDYIVNNREISNQIFVLGTLLKDPKMYTTKQGLQITQYPVALNRKYTVRADDPSIRTDYPIVKSYGEQAINDKIYLRYQADVIIDGIVQAREITRKCKCKNCENIYEWKDRTMELVPYDVEYVSGHRTQEEVEKEEEKSVEELKQLLFTSSFKDELDDELKSEDVKSAE